jgi:hypothetical protein
MRTFVFRGVDPDQEDGSSDNGLYAVRVNSKFIGSEKALTTSLAHTFAIGDALASCNRGLFYSVGGGNGGDDCPECPPTTNPPDTSHWEHKNISTNGLNMGDPSGGTPDTSAWYRTEDSVRTNYFHVLLGDTVVTQDAIDIPDSGSFGSTFSNSLDTVTMKLEMKDSASHQNLIVLDSFVIIGGNTPTIHLMNPPFKVPQMPPFPVVSPNGECPSSAAVKIANIIKRKVVNSSQVPPSGAAYLTVKLTKSAASTLRMTQTMEYDKLLEDNTTVDSNGGSFKKGEQPQSTNASNPLHISIRPNPFTEQTDISLDAVKDVPINVTVFDVLGHPVKTLLNGVSDKDHYQFTVQGNQLQPGHYYVRSQCGNFVLTEKMELVK